MRVKQSGITLLELMVVVAIVAILAAVAYPSFTDGLRQSRRAEAFKGLLSMQLKQEEYRISHPEYVKQSEFQITPSLLGNPTSDYYTFTISGATTTTYTLIATTKAAQIGDKAGSTNCNVLELKKDDTKGLTTDCWK
ncbi:type IV pilin protein [Aeromonas encheleia]